MFIGGWGGGVMSIRKGALIGRRELNQIIMLPCFLVLFYCSSILKLKPGLFRSHSVTTELSTYLWLSVWCSPYPLFPPVLLCIWSVNENAKLSICTWSAVFARTSTGCLLLSGTW